MNQDYLELVFNNALVQGLDVRVEVTIPGQEDTEFIINKNSSIKNKLEYYKKTYDHKCVHKHCNEIKIVSVRKLKFKEDE